MTVENNSPFNYFVCALGVDKFYVRVERKYKNSNIIARLFNLEPKGYYFGLNRKLEDTIIIAGKSFYRGNISGRYYIRTYYNYDNELKVYSSTKMAENAILNYIKGYNERKAEQIAEKKQDELDKEFVLRFIEYQYP